MRQATNLTIISSCPSETGDTVRANLCISYELNRGNNKDYSDLLADLERFEDRHALESV